MAHGIVHSFPQQALDPIRPPVQVGRYIVGQVENPVVREIIGNGQKLGRQFRPFVGIRDVGNEEVITHLLSVERHFVITEGCDK